MKTETILAWWTNLPNPWWEVSTDRRRITTIWQNINLSHFFSLRPAQLLLTGRQLSQSKRPGWQFLDYIRMRMSFGDKFPVGWKCTWGWEGFPPSSSSASPPPPGWTPAMASPGGPAATRDVGILYSWYFYFHAKCTWSSCNLYFCQVMLHVPKSKVVKLSTLSAVLILTLTPRDTIIYATRKTDKCDYAMQQLSCDGASPRPYTSLFFFFLG